MRDRRIHDRTAVAFYVCVTVIANPELSAAAVTLDVSNGGLSVCLPFHLMPGSLVRVDIADSVLHGFIAHSHEWPNSARPSFARNKLWTETNWAAEGTESTLYHTGIDISEISIGESGLSQLLEATIEETRSNHQMTSSGSKAS
jgi:hypothetical protein